MNVFFAEFLGFRGISRALFRMFSMFFRCVWVFEVCPLRGLWLSWACAGLASRLARGGRRRCDVPVRVMALLRGAFSRVAAVGGCCSVSGVKGRDPLGDRGAWRVATGLGGARFGVRG